MGRPEWGLIDLAYSCWDNYIQNKSTTFLQDLICESTGAGNRQVLLTDLGRQAIYIALKLASSDPSEEVIVPAYACPNVILPVLSAGLKPVFADISDDLNICFEHVKTLLNKNTKAVIVPHLYGRMARIEDFDDLLKKKDIILIDDAAQSFGGVINGKWAGTYGQFGIFSFGPYKSMPGTRGGALLINEESRPVCLKNSAIMPNNGNKPLVIAFKTWIKYRMRKYSYQLLMKRAQKNTGTRSGQGELRFDETLPLAMSELNAALLNRVIKKTKRVICKRTENARRMSALLKGTERYFSKAGDFNRNIFVKYVIVIKEGYQQKRPDFISYLKNRKIECHEGYYPLHLQKAFSSYAQGELFMTERKWQGVVCLPCDAAMTCLDVDYIAKVIKDYNWE